MANSLYDKGREGFLDGSIDYDTDTIKATLIDKDKYTFSAAHTFLTSIGSSARAGTATTLTSKTVASGVAGAAPTTFSSVPSGSTVGAVVLFKDSGSSGTSRLICYIDQTSTGGTFAVVPTGGNIVVQWSTGANKIFKL